MAGHRKKKALWADTAYPIFWSSAKLTEIGTKHRSPYNCEIRSEVKNLPIKNTPDLAGFPGELHQILKKEIIPILYKLF